jgi:acyl-coenzyme A synthetase/AMP-(fatty) acid ligase
VVTGSKCHEVSCCYYANASLIFFSRGYLGNPKATQDCITNDGWFKTGDIATVDTEGYFYLVDRKKELIKYKGFQGSR